MQNSKCIGHYILGEKIGAGGFAKVKRAKHKYTNVDVAVKIINKKTMKAKKMIVKIKRQIRLLRFFDHPNVIKLYEVLENTTDIFIVMELAPGGGFCDLLLKEGALSQPQARFYFKQIISGVDYCHQNHVAHRDLKPDNILISQNGSLKLADFGLSNIMKDGRFLKTHCGSLYYAAPQLISNKNYEGTGADIWSLGIILYVMLTGTFPFDEQHQSLLKNKIMNASYKMPQFLSPQCRDLIGNILMVDSSQRIRMDKIRIHPWVIDHLPIYASITTSLVSHTKNRFMPNLQILSEILKHQYKFPDEGIINKKQAMIKMIKRKQQNSFVVAYRLLEDQKNKSFLKLPRSHNQNSITLFQEVENRLQKQKITQQKIYRYGQAFKTSARVLAKSVITMLELLKVAYKVKPYYRNENILEQKMDFRKESQQMTVEDIIDDGHSDRYSKIEVTFDIQIYGVRADLHILDIYLYNGHPMVFLKYVDLFLKMIKRVIEQ